LAEHPAMLTVEYDWGAGGREDAIGAAAHVGNREIAEFFLAQGIPNNICVAAMLGKVGDVQRFLKLDPALANARGAHGILVMFHTAMSGNTAIAQALHDQGCREGYSQALHGAVKFGHRDMVNWLLDNGASDVNVLDFQNQTPLKQALNMNLAEIVELLRQHGAKETA
jgi:uncharacterized protein